ncbi:probable E3 ubiquitin-protein ligase HERC3 [Scomber scombrus]|uniref:Probable E3 ubiquitin-protein ligase HERC3 n=1 Tax=Scomber scombrus TaxID=13677 RepID=A0AAV1PPC6_SCOSC
MKRGTAGHSVLAFVKSDGNAFIIRTNESNDGRRVRGNQKSLKYEEKIQSVSCGDDVVTLLSETGRVLYVDSAHPPFTPRPLEVLCNIPVSQVACGSQHSVALTKDGQVYTWGQDSRGQLGLGRRKLGANSPQHLRSLSSIPLVQIATGGEQSFALSVSGGVFSWGRNDCGQLGLGDTTDRHTPNPVHSLDMKKTIHISCGKDHTAILTKDGEVFTFGCGQYGQLGHNSFSDELCPRLVAEPQGSKVIKIACGRHHTLVMTDSKKVYSFGCGEQGQLGHGEESHQSVPLPVQLPQDAIDVPQIRDIYAGGNCSFATCSSTEQDVHEGSNSDSMNKVQHCLDGLIDRWTSEHDSKSWEKIKQEIQRTFSSASCVNQSFLEQSRDKHFQTSPTYSGLNLSVARRNFKKLVKKNNVLAEVEAAVTKLIPSLNEKPVGVEGLRIYLLLIELLHVIQKHKQPESTNLTKAVAAAIVRLSADSLQVIGDWWSSLSASTMIKYIDVWKQTLSVILSSDPDPRNTGVKNLLLVLQHMYNANSRTAEAGRVPDNNFCLLIEEHFLKEDLRLWRSWSQHKNVSAEPLILCNFPIVMDLQTKKNVFDEDAACTRMETMDEYWWDLFNEYGREELPEEFLLNLDLTRASVLEDAFEQLAAVDHSDYKKPLLVYFDANDHHFDDDNLNIKDFFHDVFHAMFSAESEMFMFNDSNTLAWFPSKATQDEKRYFLFGVLCGLALFNQCIIHLPFPLVLFKKLLGVKPSLEDMMEFKPYLGKTLQYILEVDDIENMDMYFLINWDETDVDLDPDNPEKPLTSQNKKEYVDAYVNYAFNTSVVRLFQEFKRGFFQVCDQDFVKLFQPKQLQEILVGKDFHDWTKLKQNTVYEGDYNAGHPTIQMFWEVLDELTEDQKADFLWFLTGFEKVPILGLDTINMKVQVTQIEEDLTYDWYYPKTHTCNSTLELPIYSSKEIMRDKLTEALSKKRSTHN